MATLKRRILVLFLVVLAPLFIPVPGSVLAAPGSSHLLQTAPCYTAAMQALTKQGAIYSQGGYLAGDPINPATGQPYPRTGPDSFDCSGLVWWAYAQAGVSIGATTYQQVNNGVSIPCRLADLHGSTTTCWALGDLIFLSYVGGQHVAIYVGSGLFMDCYNHSTGCILHDVTTDSFYAAHFSQARRIVSGCEGFANNPGSPSSPVFDPEGDVAFSVQAPLDWSLIPDLVGYVSITTPSCTSCSGPPPISPLPEPAGNAGNWLDLGSWINWLGIRIYNIMVNLICWLFMMLQIVVNFLALIANSFLYAVNLLWKFAIFAWLTIKAWLYAGVVLFELIRGLLVDGLASLSLIAGYVELLAQLGARALDLIGQLVQIIAQLAGAAIGIIGWIGGLTLSLIGSISLALQGVGVPTEIGGAGENTAYRFTRGVLDGFIASQIGWLFWLSIAMAYVSFFVWIARYLPTGSKGE